MDKDDAKEPQTPPPGMSDNTPEAQAQPTDKPREEEPPVRYTDWASI